jgi:hypothetical protein
MTCNPRKMKLKRLTAEGYQIAKERLESKGTTLNMLYL